MKIDKANDKLGKMISMYFASPVLTYIGIPHKKITPINTELLDPDLDHRFLDCANNIDEKFILNIEFQNGNLNKSILNRFMKYAGDTKLKTDKKVYSIVISTGKREKSIKIYEINEYSRFVPKIIFLKEDCADEKLKKIEEKIDNQVDLNELEMAWLILIPFMSSKFTSEKLTEKVCNLTMKLIDNKKEDVIGLRTCMYLLINIFVENEKTRRKLREVIKMQGSYTQRVINDIKEEGREEGIGIGKEEIIAVAVSNLKDSYSSLEISNILGTSEEIVKSFL